MSKQKIKSVNILETTSTGQAVLGSVLLVNDEISYLNLPPAMVEELDAGIFGLNGEKFTKEDGILFLENLRYNYSGSYIRATGVL